MYTVTLSIGNSDDKLTQAQWSDFIEKSGEVAKVSATQIHFSGTSFPDSPFQNATWVFTLDPLRAVDVWPKIRALAWSYGQDSIAVTLGATQLVPAEKNHYVWELGLPTPVSFPLPPIYDPDKL